MKHVTKARAWFLCAIALTLALTGTVFGEQDSPRLEAENELLSLDFTDSTIRTVFEAIGTAGGLKFDFDDKFDANAKTSVFLSDISVLNALRFVARSNDLFCIVRDSRTVFISPDTRQKRKEHMPQGTRTFPLKYAEPRTVITVLRSLLQTRQLVHDDQRNTITMEDTISQLNIAEEVIERLDRENGAALDREPLWIGSAFNHDMRTRGDSIPQLAADAEHAVKIDLDDATARQVYKTLGETSGVEFIFDRRIDPGQSASFALPKMSFRKALDLVNERFGYFSVVWGPRTVYITPDIDWKRMIEEHVAIQFFYLSHTDPRSVITALRSEIQSRQIAEISRLNAVVIRDTVAKLEAAQEVVEGMDRANGQVALDETPPAD